MNIPFIIRVSVAEIVLKAREREGKKKSIHDCCCFLLLFSSSGGTRGGKFRGEIDRCRESQGWTTACYCNVVVCPNVTGRTKERIAQKRFLAGSLTIVVLT